MTAFRDRDRAFDRARELEASVARLLVRAPELPVDVPQFGVRLLGVFADARGVGLRLGRDAPIGSLYYRAPGSGEAKVPTVEAWPARTETKSLEDRAVLEKMRARLGSAASHVDWSAVWPLVTELRESPARLPLEFLRQLVGGVSPKQGLVRTGFRCNQDCGFCWQGRTWATFDAEQIVTWIEDLREQGAERLIVSGGEPTLDRELFRYLERATALGMRVTLETNAMRMAQTGFVERLEHAAPGFDAFVSFHSADADVSDRATRAPGTHAKTVRGVKALLAAGVRVKLNAVITAQTIDALPSLPDFIRAEFAAAPSFRGLMLSLPQTPFDESLDRELRASPESIHAALGRVIARAAEHGIALDGLDGPCGPPLCAFDADRRVTALTPVPHAVDFRGYLPACDGCSVRAACFGVHRSDLDVFGERCARPL